MVGLSAHERPPAALRELFKRLRKLEDLESDPQIVDFERLDKDALPDTLRLERCSCRSSLAAAFDQFTGCSSPGQSVLEDVAVYSHQALPCLKIMPALLPPTVQIELLNRLLHRDLSNQRHLTNLHLHYDVTYPAADSGNQSVHGKPSFFQDDPNRLLVPKDPSVHAPLSIRSLLDRKLRWVTLGGQYNWTEKVYPAEAPPEFPADIASLLHTIFPDTTAEAAIVNIYSPGDTLSVHRDVSEECDTGLISISFGCEGLFMIGNDGESNCVVLRLRSGDAVYMTGSSRFAWHAVPKILPSTCPAWLSDWPGGDEAADQEAFRHWKGWMSGKRVNLNVRQMKPKPDS